jgi:signal transduction histidine kinase
MNEILQAILTSNLVPHGYCMAWEKDIVVVHVLSDLAIAVAYVSIPIALAQFARKRRDFPFPKLLLMFSAFIFACAATHVMGLVTLWWPVYRVEGAIKALTAGISLATALTLRRKAPSIMALRSPAELAAANDALRSEVKQRIEAENEVAKARDELESRVADRTRELETRNAQLAAANHELDNFAYLASHDLKAPLRAVWHLAQWIQEEAGNVLPERSSRDLETLRQRVKRMDGLLDSLLEYSRAGRLRAEPEDVDPNTLVASIVTSFDLKAGMTIRVTSDLPRISTPHTPFATVFRNLILNAVKHHDRDAGTVEISHRDLGALVEFAVGDDGPGIPPAYHERIFQMFEVLNPRDEVEGSGMGLAIVKKNVESYGGTIHVDSPNGRGARFRFTWPKATRSSSIPRFSSST